MQQRDLNVKSGISTHQEDQYKKSSSKRSWFPRDYKQCIDALWRLACIALAIWAFTNMQSPTIGFVLLAASQTHNAGQLLATIFNKNMNQ